VLARRRTRATRPRLTDHRYRLPNTRSSGTRQGLLKCNIEDYRSLILPFLSMRMPGLAGERYRAKSVSIAVPTPTIMVCGGATYSQDERHRDSDRDRARETRRMGERAREGKREGERRSDIENGAMNIRSGSRHQDRTWPGNRSSLWPLRSARSDGGRHTDDMAGHSTWLPSLRNKKT
jgi:hypothetical protein